jgi:hypothetical protein
MRFAQRVLAEIEELKNLSGREGLFTPPTLPDLRDSFPSNFFFHPDFLCIATGVRFSRFRGRKVSAQPSDVRKAFGLREVIDLRIGLCPASDIKT